MYERDGWLRERERWVAKWLIERWVAKRERERLVAKGEREREMGG